VLGIVGGNINAGFIHYLNSEGMDITHRIRAGALHIKRIAQGRAKKAFRKMAPARVTGAENEYDRLFYWHWRLHNSAGSSLRILLSFWVSAATFGLPASDFLIHARVARTAIGAPFPGNW